MRADLACAVELCEKPVECRQWCQQHYDRWRRNGDPLIAYRDRRVSCNVPVPEHFAAYATIRDTNECIEWEGSRQAAGYGAFTNAGAYYMAHRVAYELHVGPIPEGHLIRHSCDNPPCVNPRHLSTGLDADNTKDKVDRGRHPVGEASNFAKLTAAAVLDIRQRVSRGEARRDLAARYSVSTATIGDIATRKSWAHLEEAS